MMLGVSTHNKDKMTTHTTLRSLYFIKWTPG